MSKITSKRGRVGQKPVHEEVDIELDLNDFEDTLPLPTTDDEEFEYFVDDEEFIFGGGYTTITSFNFPVVSTVKV